MAVRADAARVADTAAGKNLLDLHVVKGLEFDAVVVVEPADILAQWPDGGIGALSTALTRYGALLDPDLTTVTVPTLSGCRLPGA